MTKSDEKSIIEHYKKFRRGILRRNPFFSEVTILKFLLSLGIALLAGLFMTRLVKLWNLPAVTAYLVAGILIGPYCLGMLPIEGLGFISMGDDKMEYVKQFDLISKVALGFIALAMGNEFRVSELKKIGKKAVVIAIFQALVATIFVDVALFLVHQFWLGDLFPMPVVLTMGAIATATAPAATLMVVKQYKADGPLTKTLLPVVALDDAVGLIVFAVSFGIAKAMDIPGGTVDAVSVLVNPLIEVVGSLLLGAAAGYLFYLSEKLFLSRSKRMSVAVAFIFLAVGLSMMEFQLGGGVRIGFSSLLVCMMLGTVFCNLSDISEELMERCDRWTGPVMVLFFVLSGAGLELDVFRDWKIVVVGLIFILARSLGKIEGAKVSSGLMKCEPQVQKYLGITLLPQAGVALGMSLIAMEQLDGESGRLIRSLSLFAVLIYELFGPILTKWALGKAGEIPEEHKHAD